MIASAAIISNQGNFFDVRSCAQIDYVFYHFANYTVAFYPACAAYYSGENLNQHVVVEANMDGDPAQVGAALGVTFGMSFWLALTLHAVGVEIYVGVRVSSADLVMGC